ncbi:MAG: hypothetical protein DRH08_09275 [Deltaproteobacteria bacterium]|nr:MAG: hypothetical protein DRH08_09275 [Deltaproteobacteria bacterium]
MTKSIWDTHVATGGNPFLVSDVLKRNEATPSDLETVWALLWTLGAINLSDDYGVKTPAAYDDSFEDFLLVPKRWLIELIEVQELLAGQMNVAGEPFKVIQEEIARWKKQHD